MKKDIGWLKGRFRGRKIFKPQNDREVGYNMAIDEFSEYVDQLDETEVLSREYLIHNTDDDMDGYYLAKFSFNSKGHPANIGWVSDLYNPMVTDALRFDSKEKAEAVALLVDGEVEEVEE